ncbi:con-Ins Im2 [Patella vulgata]|uniref:con-Ins Im2 n=1 Tax=Patella vulgata TaxID=6465 RepID=UPI00217F7E4B|nr:con-Ins Im2 [Patella vulgata]
MEGMCKCPLVLLGVLFLNLGTVLGHLEWTCTLETKREAPRGVCGRRLPDLLSLVCVSFGGYREKWFRKRSDEDTAHNLKNIILGKRDAFSYLSKRRSSYGEQGITCECCYHACSFRELRQYCKDPNQIKKRSVLIGNK